MAQLLSHYSVSEIILFIIFLALAAKSFIDFIDWAKKRTTQAVKDAQKPLLLEKSIKKHDKELEEIKEDIHEIKRSVNLLILSDKDDIKDSLTKDHHYFCYKLKSIDDYSLECMERRYSHYKDEGGNSFVKQLMLDVRLLPRKLELENR